MPLIIILMMVIAGSLSSCDAAHAFTITEGKLYNERERIDLSRPVRDYLHDELDLPSYLTITALDKHEVKISLHWEFQS